MNKSNKLLNGFIAFAIVTSFLAVVLYWNVSEQLNNRYQDIVKPIQKGEQPEECPENWEHYSHDVIGIKFCYPKEWGKPSTSPIENITRISNMEEEFKTQNIYYENMFFIGFEKNKQASIMLFNNKYNGKSQIGKDEPHVYYESGATGDIVNLRNNNNICDYKIGYDYRYNQEMKADTLKTIYSDCSNKIKMVLTENKETFNFENYGTLYTYDLRLLSFKKLANGYFDNILISREIDKARQIHEELKALDEFFEKEKTTSVKEGLPIKNKEQSNQELKEFGDFIKTIIAYKPIQQIQKGFEEISNEDSNITAVRKYYWLLSSGKLKEAYEMRSLVDNNVSFEEFHEWYKNLYYAKPYDFEKNNFGIYRFYVEYQDHNNPKTRYRVEMSTDKNNKLKTISSVRFLTEIISSGKYSAYAYKRGDKNYMVLSEEGKETIIDQGSASFDQTHSNIEEVKFFYDPRFSPKGNYLAYSVGGYEWSFDYIYDLKLRKESMHSYYGEFNFTPDESYVYRCASAGMVDSPAGDIYKAPDFKIIYDVFNNLENKKYLSVNCDYESETESIVFWLGDYAEDKKDIKKKIRYLLKEGREEIEKIE